MTALVAIAIISAQETMPGHCDSKAAFKASMTSNPLTDRLGLAYFSAAFSSIRIDASQPFQITL